MGDFRSEHAKKADSADLVHDPDAQTVGAALQWKYHLLSILREIFYGISKCIDHSRAYHIAFIERGGGSDLVPQ
jgi:hypothetical protein